MAANEKTACPSARGKPGALLLGVRQEDGSIAILPQALPVDESFVNNANRVGVPEQQFRFAGKCVEGGCVQWTGSRCGIADRILQQLDAVQPADVLPPCSIRPRCRWHLQSGADACRVCQYVVTEITQEEIATYDRR